MKRPDARILVPLAAGLLLLLAGCAANPPYVPPPPAPVYSPPQYDPPPPSRYSLHDRVHAALESSPDLRHTRISVQTEPGGIVYLSGYVYTREQRRIAHNVAHAVDGVSRVFYRELYVH